MPKFIVLDYELLKRAGIIDDPASTRRVLIDLQVGSPARVIVEKFGDSDKLAEVFESAKGTDNVLEAIVR